MNMVSMLVESIRVANRLESSGPQSRLEQAGRFVADSCTPVVRDQPEDPGLETLELFDSAFMKPF